jgi:hypothetical protein
MAGLAALRYGAELMHVMQVGHGSAGIPILRAIREVWTPDQRFAERRRSMRRIMARRTKVAALRAWRS